MTRPLGPETSCDLCFCDTKIFFLAETFSLTGEKGGVEDRVRAGTDLELAATPRQFAW